MITIVNGNLLEATEDIICHQVNCQGVMGSGIAAQIRKKWPNVYTDYKLYVERYQNLYKSPLGTMQIVPLPNKQIVCNIFGQDNYGRDKRCTSYDALYEALCSLDIYASTNNLTIAMPYGIGCGLGGGDWRIVREIISSVFEDADGNIPVTIYKWAGEE